MKKASADPTESDMNGSPVEGSGWFQVMTADCGQWTEVVPAFVAEPSTDLFRKQWIQLVEFCLAVLGSVNIFLCYTGGLQFLR